MAQPKRRGVNDAGDIEAQRLNVRLSPAAYQRLMIHCVMSGTQPGRFIENLINAHCREWRVQANRIGQATADDRLEAASELNLAGTAAA
jgi:hypothetical protein